MDQGEPTRFQEQPLADGAQAASPPARRPAPPLAAKPEYDLDLKPTRVTARIYDLTADGQPAEPPAELPRPRGQLWWRRLRRSRETQPGFLTISAVPPPAAPPAAPATIQLAFEMDEPDQAAAVAVDLPAASADPSASKPRPAAMRRPGAKIYALPSSPATDEVADGWLAAHNLDFDLDAPPRPAPVIDLTEDFIVPAEHTPRWSLVQLFRRWRRG